MWRVGIVALFVCQLPPAGSPPTAGGWLKPPPLGAFEGPAAREVAESCIYEVVASKWKGAELIDLKDRGCRALTPDEAKNYTGAYFSCPAGKKPYLVRAVYGFGGTGKYFVRTNGRDLVVQHGSLGRSVPANRSALVVNLDFEPAVTFTSVSVAE